VLVNNKKEDDQPKRVRFVETGL